MISKIGAVLVGLLLALGLGSSAFAYEITAPGSSVSSSTVAPGGSVTFSATGFDAGSTVTVTATRAGSSESRSASVTASSTGAVSTSFTLGSAGRWTITASGVRADGAALSVSSDVLVSAGSAAAPVRDSSGSGAALARTGVDGLATTAWVGFGVLVLGGVLVAVASGRGRSRDLQDA